MIQFACRKCGEMLEVPGDMAGSAVQCPKCGILNDAPAFSDLESLADDGTFKMGGPVEADPELLAKLMHAFAKKDREGNELDHRGPVTEEGAYELMEEPPAEMKPKYDPDTGELVRPMEVRQNTGPDPKDDSNIPMAKPALTYATGSTRRRTGLLYILVDLFRPLNFFVVCFIFGVHVFVGFLMFLSGLMRFPIGAPMFLIFIMALLAHWGNIVDETGREERNELPRPFRDLRFYEDFWEPFCAFFGALLICYGPGRLLLLVGHQSIATWATSGVLDLIGTFLFPAVFMTTCMSDAFSNLHPLRLLSVIRICGSGYAIAVLAWTLGALAYLWPVMIISLVWWPKWIQWVPWWWGISPVTLVPAILWGVFCMHWFSWTVGMLYGTHHERFPWLGHQHVRIRRDTFVRKNPMPRARTTPRYPRISVPPTGQLASQPPEARQDSEIGP